MTVGSTGSERNALILPATVTIAGGNRSITFPVKVSASGVSAAAEVAVTATYNGVTKSVTIRLRK